MRFVAEEEEIPVSTVGDETSENKYEPYRPVAEHILTPVPSQLEIQQMEAEAIFGSPMFSTQTTSVSFVETLLLRLLDDLNSNRLDNDEILKLASYCMDVLQTKELEGQRQAAIMEAAEEDMEGPYAAASTSSILAKQMVDFTLGKILSEIKSGKVMDGDMAALTATVLGAPSTDSLSGIELDDYIHETMQKCVASAQDDRENTPICDALLDNFVALTLQNASQAEESRSQSSVCDAMLDEYMDTTLRAASRAEHSGATSPVCDALIDDLIGTTLRSASRGQGSGTVSPVGNALLTEFVQTTLRTASRAEESGRQSPVCDALLDDFMVLTLKKLIQDLEEEVLSKAQIQALASTVKDEAKDILPSESDNIEDLQGVRKVLGEILRQLQTGAIEQHLLYQIVFAIVYTYNTLKSPPTPDFENRITGLMKDVLFIVEQQATKENIFEIDLDLAHEASERLSQTELDVNQIEKLSSTIISTVAKPDIICRTSTSEIARSLVENALAKAKQKLLEDEKNRNIMLGVENVASAIISTLEDAKTTSESVNDTFLDILGYLKQNIGPGPKITKEDFVDLQEIINQVDAHELTTDDLKEMACSVARVVSSPLKSESSLTAEIHVRDTLHNIRDDMIIGSLERNIMDQMTTNLLETYRTIKAHDEKAPALLKQLVSFFMNILKHVTYKVECGDLTANDISELSEAFQTRFTKQTISSNADEVLECISRITDDIGSGVLSDINAEEFGKRLIECGKKIAPSVADAESVASATGSEKIAETVVEEVIKSVQSDIDRGLITTETLKEITKTIISVSSGSETRLAEEAVSYTIRGIHRDIERGFEPARLPSLPTLDRSPSVSTIAENVVIHTIEHINQYFQEQEPCSPLTMSIASSLITLISEESILEKLPEEFKSVRKTIVRIVQCLRSDVISQIDAEQIFCAILENYRDIVLSDKKKEVLSSLPDSLPREDQELVNDLVQETLKNIERSVAAGKMKKKQFSIPSIKSDVGTTTSMYAEELVDLTLDNIKDYFAAKSKTGSSTICASELVGRTLDNVKKYKSTKSLAGSSTIYANDLVEHTLDDMKKYVSTKSLAGSSTIVANDVVDQTLYNVKNYKSTKSIAGSTTIYANDLVEITLDNMIPEKQLKTDTGSTTAYAYDLVNLTLENLREDLEKRKLPLPKSKRKDIVDFILEIIDTLAIELSKGNVSDLSMAHFFMSISGDTSDLSILEANAQANLRKVCDDIIDKRSSSNYIQRILETYLSPGSTFTELFSDPIKAVESIMISVSSEILTKFVKATLQNILVEIREGSVSLPEKAPSTFILRSASSIVAENVIQEVVSRIKHDISTSVKKPLQGALSKQEFDRAASTLVGSPIVTGRVSQEKKASESGHSIASIMSREVEDVVLETLHNIVSNLRLEQSMYPQKFQNEKAESMTMSNEIQEFVLDTLQNIVTDLQDKKALKELGLARVPEEGGNSEVQLQTAQSCETATYVNEVLQSVLEDLKREHGEKFQDFTGGETHSKTASNLESMILDCLQNAVSEKMPPEAAYGLEPDQEDDIKNIVTESIKQTIQNIKNHKLKEADLKSVKEALSSFVASEKDESVTEENMVLLLETVIVKTEDEGLDEQTLGRISTQLATLGMESIVLDENDTQNVLSSSDVSSNSSLISDLIQTVIEKITNELETETNNQTSTGSQEKVPSVSSSNTTPKKNVNYNRKLSASSAKTKNSDSSDLSDVFLPDNSDTPGNTKIVCVKERQQKQSLAEKQNKTPETNKKGILQQKNSQTMPRDQKPCTKVQTKTPKTPKQNERVKVPIQQRSHVDNLHKVISKPKPPTSKLIQRQGQSNLNSESKPSTQSGYLAKSYSSPGIKRQTAPLQKPVSTGKSQGGSKKKDSPSQTPKKSIQPYRTIKTQAQPKSEISPSMKQSTKQAKSSPGLSEVKPNTTETRKTMKTVKVQPSAKEKSQSTVNKKPLVKIRKQNGSAPQKESPYEIKSLCGVHKTKLTLRETSQQSDTSGVSNSEDDHSCTSEIF